VYDATVPTAPVFLQVLATSTSGPEGIVAIPSRKLIAVANENDDRVNKFRSTISIYQDNFARPDYPSLESVPRVTGTQGPFIPFSALSGLAASPGFGTLPNNLPTTLYTVEDSFFRSNRIMTIEVTLAGPPYRVTSELTMKDTAGVLNATLATFPTVVLSSRINADLTVNIDPEGIAISRVSNTVWVVSEGAGATAATLTLPNLLLQVSLVNGAILRAIALPPAVNALHTNNGFEGVAEYGEHVVVAFQREWVGETKPRLGIYNYVLNTWKFVFYPLDTYTSQFNPGAATSWVGLSEIAPVGNGKFLILERDNQGGPDAAIKRLYEIDLGSNLTSLAENITVSKTLKLDMIPVLRRTWGFIPEKVEGVAIDSLGNVWVNNDNDGIVNNAGEQQLNLMGQLYFPKISSAPSAAPSRSPVRAPVKAPVPLPVPLPVPVAVPVALPVPTPVKAPVVAPVPVTAPVTAPVPVPVTPAPVTKAPVDNSCGLFGFRIFCPFTFCGLFGRFIRICRD
jgi:Esterase-like activity of phytase